MTADLVQAEYQQLEKIAVVFADEQQKTQQISRRLQRQLERLQGGGWVSDASSAFYRDMLDQVMPGVDRLVKALDEGSSTTRQIIQILKRAEEDAAQALNNGDGAVPNGSGGGMKLASMTGAAGFMAFGNDRNGDFPSPPPDPSQPNSGDGTGEHGAGGEPTDADRDTHSKMGWAASGARLKGYDITASHMEHYLGNSGDDMDVDVDRMMTEMPEFQQATQQQYQQNVLSQVNEQIAANYNGQPMEFEVKTPWRSDFYPSKADYPNWYYGVGGFSYSQTAVVSVTPNPNGGNPTVNVDSRVHMFDRYNWDAGKSVTIPSSGNDWIDEHTIAGDHIPDTQMGRLHSVGIAQEYDMRGDSNTTSSTYTYDPNSGSVQAPPPDSGGR